MRKNKKSLLGLTAIAAGCATLLSIPAFANESVKATMPAVTITTAIQSDAEGSATTVNFAMAAYDELATQGIVSKETVDKMNVFANSRQSEVEAELDRLSALSEAEVNAYFESSDSLLNLSDLESMVAENIITQAEKEKIDAYYDELLHKEMEREIRNSADRYVNENIVSREVADQMISNEMAHIANSSIDTAVSVMVAAEAVTDTDENSTPEDYTITFSSAFDLDELIANQVITAAQKDAIMASDQKYYEELYKDIQVEGNIAIATVTTN